MGKSKVQQPKKADKKVDAAVKPKTVVNHPLLILPKLVMQHFNIKEDLLEKNIKKEFLEGRSPQVIVTLSKFIWELSEESTPEDKGELLQRDILLDLIALYSSTSTSDEQKLKLLEKFDQQLLENHFLSGCVISLSDFALFCLLKGGLSKQHSKLLSLKRWLKTFIATVPVSTTLFKAAAALQNAQKNKTKGVKAKPGDKKVSVCPPLKETENLDMIVTRFPPEPSGHLHIGHCKALFLNQYYAKRYNGKMLLRFDDTNPSKEKAEYEEGIVNDLKSLSIDISKISHTSDHFELIQNYAIQLIKQGDAYMDNSDVETLRAERDQGIENKNRSNDVATNLKYFDDLVKGTETGQKYCLRGKLDMQSPNKCLRDPVFFRYNPLPHLQTGTKYVAYPTYDLACPIVDSVEGVTHAMRDMNYKDRVPLYNWVLEKLKLRKIVLQDFSRMNFVYTLMSKRKLKWLVDNNIANDWNDPRFPTIKGLLRRGVQVDALNEYMVSQGASRKACDIEWDKFWNVNKKKIDPVVPRYMAVDAHNVLRLKLTDFKSVGNGETRMVKQTPKHPKDLGGVKYGMKDVVLTASILLESEDVTGNGGVKEKELILLLQWGVVEVTKVIKNGDEIVSLEGELRPEAKISEPERKIHWLADDSSYYKKGRIYEFDHLISKPVLEADDEFQDFLNKDSWAETEVLVNPEVAALKPNDCLQLLRRGYYRVDQVGDEVHLFTIPDGKSKAMSTFSSATAKMKHQ